MSLLIRESCNRETNLLLTFPLIHWRNKERKDRNKQIPSFAWNVHQEPSLDQGECLALKNFFMEQIYAAFEDSDAVEDYELQKEAEDPIAFATSHSDPDTLHYNQAMQT
jgi:hypothetical protein